MIKLLDCTLRDGGYINDWNFGKSAIQDIERKMVDTGAEIVEVGFLKKEEYNPDRTVFSAVEQINPIIAPKKKNVLYAAMVEVVNPLPIEDFTEKTEESVDIIRVIVWKRLLKEGFEYCKAISEKGYKICVQPARVSQYSDSEFIAMIELFSQINPLAIYVVDSWGTQDKEDILRYVGLADTYMAPSICLGYHGHNNLQQAFGCAEACVNLGLKRDFIIDASVYGIGRGAGNLNLELFAKYLNRNFSKKYSIQPMIEVYDRYIKNIFMNTPWGYSIPFFLTATYDCNPEFACYYDLEKHVPIELISKILSKLDGNDKVIFSKDKADAFLEKAIASN